MFRRMFFGLMLSLFLGGVGRSDAQPLVPHILAGRGEPDSTVSRSFTGDGGEAGLAQLINPFDVVSNGKGHYYVLDTSHQRVRLIDEHGIIQTVAGTGDLGQGLSDGLAIETKFADPVGLGIDADGNLYVADTFNHVIRKIDLHGQIQTIVGTGAEGFSGDNGLARLAQLSRPTDVFVTPTGEIFIADQGNHRIRKVDRDGVMHTVAGNGHHGYEGDGGLADETALADPAGVFVASDGVLYIADRSNHRVRKVDAKGRISTVAGSGQIGFSGDGGPANDADLSIPTRVVIDQNGLLYICDRGNGRIRRVDPSGRIFTVLGPDDQLLQPYGLSIDPNGEILVSDTQKHIVLRVPQQARWLGLVPDRLTLPANGQDVATFLAEVSDRESGVPLSFWVVNKAGSLTVTNARSQTGLAGTQFTSLNPGLVTLRAQAPGALPISWGVDVAPVHHISVDASARSFVANGINRVEIRTKSSDLEREIHYLLTEGQAEVDFENGVAVVRSNKPGKITITFTSLGALPVEVDLWATDPKPWQRPDPYESQDDRVTLVVGEPLVRSFHNDEDIDLVDVRLSQWSVLDLDGDTQISVGVLGSGGDVLDTFQLPGRIFADNETNEFVLRLSGPEGSYALQSGVTPTTQLVFEPVERDLIGDGVDEVVLKVRTQDRFGQPLQIDLDDPVNLDVYLDEKLLKRSSKTLENGMAQFTLKTDQAGELLVTVQAKGFEPISKTITVKPALLLKEGNVQEETVVVELSSPSGLSGITGFQARVAFDSDSMRFVSFEPAGLFESATPLVLTDVEGAVEVNVAHFDRHVVAAGGVLGYLRFAFKDPKIRNGEVVLLEGRYGKKSQIFDFAVSSTFHKVNVGPDQTDGVHSFQNSFGSRAGQAHFVARFDLNGNGTIDFADYLLWLKRNDH